MTSLRITVHDDTPEWVFQDCMTVMVQAFEPQFGEAWTAAQTRGMMQMPGTHLLIGRLGDEPVAFALVRQVLDEAELMLLGVSPDYRRKGYGHALLQRTIDFITSTGCTHYFLEVRDGNPARYLYASAGFTQYNRRPGYYRGTDGTLFDAISYSIDL